jgi:hypothetical protein
MYLDPNANQTYNLVSEMMDLVEAEKELQLIKYTNPKFSKDGNMYCFTFGEAPNDCVQGFGETAEKAMHDYWMNWHNCKAVNTDKINPTKP